MRCLIVRSRGSRRSRGALARLDAPARVAAPTAVAELPQRDDCETLTDAGDSRCRAIRAAREARDAAEPASIARGPRSRSAATRTRARTRSRPAIDADVARRAPAAAALRSSIEARIGDPAAARTQLDEALVAAANASAPELELDVWSRRLRNELFAGDPAKVLEWAAFARAAAKRAGRQGAELDGIVGEALRAAGKLGRARDAARRARSRAPIRCAPSSAR